MVIQVRIFYCREDVLGNQCRSVCYFVLRDSRGVLNLTQVLMAGDCGEGWCLFLNVWCSWDAVVN